MRFWLALALLGLVAQPATAQPAPGPTLSAQLEPPARVGAVSYVSGNLAFHLPGGTQWSVAGVNYPVATGGSFWTDPQARAQIQIGPSTISMDGGTEIDVTDLNEQTAQLGLPQGRVDLHLRQLDPGQSFEIDLPQGAVRLLQPGSYDIDAGAPNQGARIAVFAGNARFVGSGADIAVNPGDAVVLSQTNPVAATAERAGRDGFVEWCSAHDYQEDHLASTHYISPHMTGYADLDHYGGWQTSPQYGEVWYPSQVPADWAPYRDGRWIWVAPWGWTWVDQRPWGFAPFHYGRWARFGDRWGWVPGSYVARPVYAPALVAFVGLRAAGIGISTAASPAVGWFPLAPGEPYWPSYTRNTTYIRNVNITNVKNINTVIVESHGGAPPPQVANANFANRRFATVVPQRVFARADPVASAIVHIPPAALQQAPVVIHPPRITPVVAHTSVVGPPRPLAGVAALGPGRLPPRATGTAGAPAQPPHPGTALQHPAAPAAQPANTAALAPHPGEIAPAEHNRPGLPPAREHPGAPAAARPEHPAAPVAQPANIATLAPHPNEIAPHAVAPGTARPASVPGAFGIHPAAGPHPAAPAVHPPVEAQIIRPPAGHPAPAPVHPAAPAIAVARPEAPAGHPAPAPVHPAAPAAERPIERAAQTHPPASAAPHPPAAAPAHPQPAHAGGKPAPKEKGKEDEGQR